MTGLSEKWKKRAAFRFRGNDFSMYHFACLPIIRVRIKLKENTIQSYAADELVEMALTGP
jgi:hypothetical protein